MPDQGVLRTARTVFFTAVCLLLSTTGHAFAAGDVPAPAAVVAGGGLVFLVAHRLAGREWSLIQVTGTVLVSQLGLHALFSYVPLPAATTHHSVEPPLHEHAGEFTAPLAAEPAGMAHAAPSMTLTMVLAHVVAGVLVAWWLRRGEALLWDLCRWLAAAAVPLRQVLALLQVDAPPAGPATILPVPSGERPPLVLLLSHAVSRRGPPVPAFV